MKTSGRNRTLSHQLQERLKELKCLYEFSRSISTKVNYREILQDVADLIPPAFHFPEITAGKVVFRGEVFVSGKFTETEWKLASDIIVDGVSCGTIEVFYLEERPKLDEGPFVKEERELLNNLASLTGLAVERVEAEQRARLDREQLKLVIKGSKDAPWDWDLKTNQMDYYPEWWAQLGYEADELPKDENLWKRLLHPEDFEKTNTFLEKTIPSRIENYECEFRLKHKKGHYVPILSRGFILRERDGTPIRISGTNMDLTEIRKREDHLKALNQQLQASEQQLRATEQQLRALNQQLRVNEQHLKASNQQLRAGEQQLRATNQQLRAGEQQMKAANQQLRANEQQLRASNQQLRISENNHLLKRKISDVFLQVGDEDMYREVLKIILEEMDSHYGFFGYINEEDGSLVCPSMTRDIWKECDVKEKSIVFPRESWGDSLWAITLREGKGAYANRPIKVPEGHLPVNRFLSVPILFHNKSIGLLSVGNKSSDYSDADLNLMEEMAAYIAPTLHARREKERYMQDLSDSERRHRNIVENSTILFYEHTIDHQLTYISPQSMQFLGCKPEEAMRRWTDFATDHPVNEEGVKNTLKAIESGKRQEPYELQLRKVNGEIIWVQVNEKPVVEDRKTVSIIGSLTDITAQKKTLDDYIQARDRAEESDRLKSAFLANMSHEIRTPMNGILGFTDLLRSSDVSEQEAKQYIEIIHQSGLRMMNTLNDIISVSKIDAGQMEVSINSINPLEEARAIFNFFKPEGESKGLEMRFSSLLLPKDTQFETDKAKFASVLTNLVKNAIKFTDEGFVEMEIRQEEGRLLCRITDTGIGIPANRKEAIYKRFEQADITDRRAFQGSGLGLSIAKSYVEMLEGEIWFTSEEGKGTEFFVSLPWKKVEEAREYISAKGKPVTMTLKKKLRVLLAEDDEASREHLQILLRPISEAIEAVDNGRAAVELLRAKKQFDLVLMDIKMPEMDGYEASRKIREFNTVVPIIAQSAYALEGDKDRAMEAGCNGYITKPIEADQLLEQIKKLLG